MDELRMENLNLRMENEELRIDGKFQHEARMRLLAEEEDAMAVMRMYLRRLRRGDDVDVRRVFDDVAAAMNYDPESLSID